MIEKMETKTREKSNITRRKTAQYVKFCAKNERNACLKKVSTILQKAENERSVEEQQVLGEYSEIASDLKLRWHRRDEAKRRLEEVEEPLDILNEKCKILAKALAQSEHLVVYTGAGISTAARIPDYRGTNGIWTLLQQGKDIGNHDLSLAEPTYTHMALSQLYIQKRLKYVVSQNCDGLHLRSGLPRFALSELHGNMYIEVCKQCQPAREYWRLFDVTENTARHSHKTMRRCYSCNSELIDTIVHFGERGTLQWPLNWPGACKNADAADTILCLGSSLKVLKRYPWLWQMKKPPKKRPNLYIVNLQWTPKDDCAVMKIHGKCDEVMKRVMMLLGVQVPGYNREKDPIFAHATLLCKSEQHTTSQPTLKSIKIELENEVPDETSEIKSEDLNYLKKEDLKDDTLDDVQIEDIKENILRDLKEDVKENNLRDLEKEDLKEDTIRNLKKDEKEENLYNSKIEDYLYDLKKENVNEDNVQDLKIEDATEDSDLKKEDVKEDNLYDLKKDVTQDNVRDLKKEDMKDDNVLDFKREDIKEDNFRDLKREDIKEDSLRDLKKEDVKEYNVSDLKEENLKEDNLSDIDNSINLLQDEQIEAYDLTITKRENNSVNCDNTTNNTHSSIKTAKVSQNNGSSSIRCTRSVNEQINVLPKRKSSKKITAPTVFSIDSILNKTNDTSTVNNSGNNFQTIMAYYEFANSVIQNQMLSYLTSGLYPFQTSFLYSGLHSIINPMPNFNYDFDCSNTDKSNNSLENSKVVTPIEPEVPICEYCYKIFESYSCLYYSKTEPIFQKQLYRFSKLKNCNKELVCVCCDYTTEEESEIDIDKADNKIKKKFKKNDKNESDKSPENDCASEENVDETIICDQVKKNDKLESKPNKIQAGWFGKGFKKNRKIKKKQY